MKRKNLLPGRKTQYYKIEEKKAKVESIGNILHEIFRTLLSSIRNVVPMPGSDHLTLILP